jgi:hypothetical protein
MAEPKDLMDVEAHRIIVVSSQVNIAYPKFGKQKRIEYVTVGGTRIDVSELGASAMRRTDTKAYSFPPGHPQDGVAYAVNPVEPTVYYTFAEFQQRVFESKVTEAMRLLAALGARSVAIQQVAGKRRDVAASVDASLPSVVEAGATLKRERADYGEVRYEASFQPSHTPRIPDGLRWYPYELVWQNIADLRLYGGMTDFKFVVRFETNYGISAELGLKFAGKGLGLGGQFSEFTTTEWEMSGEF